MRSVSRGWWVIGLWILWLALGSGGPSDRADRERADASLLSGVEAQLAAREYRASENSEGLQAPNRRHNLRTYFEPAGIRVVDRTAGGSPRLLELELSGVGRGSDLRAVPAGTVHAQDARVEIRRPGLVEWFVNGPDGLEQGFTIAERPEGHGKLVLELRLEGAQAKPRGEELIFETETGRKLRYGKLVAWDARGAPLGAQLAAADTGRIALAIDDAGAHYPIVIDPLLTETADTQLESNQASAVLGSAVASAGDVNGDGYADVIVGAQSYDAGQTNEGAAFVFLGSASGVPNAGVASAQAQLESNQASAVLGSAVASAGDVNGDGYDDVIVGAGYYDNGQTDEGAAFVFLGGPSGVADGNPASAHAQLESNQASAQFGTSVASAGDVNGDGYADVIVGAEGYDNGQSNEGVAFVFLGSASGVADGSPLNTHAQLESDQAAASLGHSVASAGDVNGDGYADVIVGAHLYDAGQSNEGAAFIFLGSASGVADGNAATAHAQLESNQVGTELGWSVASAGDVNGDGYADVIVGAALYDNGQTNEGAAFIFLGSASGVADGNPSIAHALLEGGQDSAVLGWSVASAGDVNGDGYADVIVGAYSYSNGETFEGGAFVFLGSASGVANGFPANAYAQLESNQMSAQYGYSVASAGDVNGDGYADVIVGAPTYDAGLADEGAAFIYHGGAGGVSGTPGTAATRLESNQAGSDFGSSVASAGDVNGDGFGDVIVGAYTYDDGQTDEGAAFVFHGSASGIPDAIPITASTQLESDQASAFLGRSVASAGDVNGDGYGDVIVGAYEYDAGQSNEGAAFVFLGSASGIADGNPTNAHAQLEGDQLDASFGYSVASAGDVNGDGYADVIVGAYEYDAGQTDEGAAFVFLGSATGVADGNPANALAQLEGDQLDAYFGLSVASAGDVNGDRYADVIAGALLYDAGQSNEGAAFVFLGSGTGVADGNPGNAHARFESDQANAVLGESVASAGDVDGDGFADVIMGAVGYDNGQSDEGAAFVFRGSASGLANGNPATAHAQLESDQAQASMGSSVASAGDVNGDGHADVIVSARYYDFFATQEGAAFVFNGSASGLADGSPVTAHGVIVGNQDIAFLASAASAGDVNGDGFADVILGFSNYDSGQTDEGVAVVFQGNRNRDGRSVRAQQRRGDGSGIAVQPWGGANAGTSFVAELRANHPQGSGRVKLQTQACPPGVSFGHASCVNAVTPSWVAVNGATPDVALSHTLAGLEANQLYRWRTRVLHAPSAVGSAGITPPPNPAHGPWRRLGAQSLVADIRTGVAAPDGDGDGVPDASDNCPSVANPGQQDGGAGLEVPADGAGDACDNCVNANNPRVAASFLTTNPWATLTGGQRDDDHDGYGNKCDGKFTGVPSAAVGALDLGQFRTSSGEDRRFDTCGTVGGTRPCAIFDLDEAAAGNSIGALDLGRYRALSGTTPGPRCASCTGTGSVPLPCTAGTAGSCF